MAFPPIGDWVAWKIGNGRSIHIGQDPWVGSGDTFKLTDHLITQLVDRGVRLLADASSRTEDHRGTIWKTAQELGLEENEAAKWRRYINQLGNNFILLTEDRDKLIWTWNMKERKFSAKLGYETTVQLESKQIECWWWSRIWKLQVPLKAILKLWLK